MRRLSTSEVRNDFFSVDEFFGDEEGCCDVRNDKKNQEFKKKTVLL